MARKKKKPGWLRRELEAAVREIDAWPKEMRDLLPWRRKK